MRIKWIALCFLLGFIIVLDPTHTPAQFGQGGGKGGKGKNRDPFGGGGGGSYTLPVQGSGGFPAPGGGGNFNRRGGDFAAPVAPAAPAPMVTTYGAGGDSKPVVMFAPGSGVAQPAMQFSQPGGNSFQFPGGGRGQGFPGGAGGFQPGGFQGGGFPGGGGGFQGAGGGPGGGGGGGRGMGDPAAMWDRMSRGQDSINLNDPSFSWMKGMMERQGQTVPADGIVTKQMFMAEAQKRMASMQGGSAPGGPMVVTLGSPGGGGSGMSFSMGQDGRMMLGSSGGGGEQRDRGLERLKELDKDGDGRVSRAEADDRLKPNFDRIDRDGDGYITLEEYRAYYAAQNGGGNNNRGNNGDMASWSGAGDMGNWGGGNRQDMRKDSEESRPVAIRYGHLPKDLPEWFDSYDTNKDGQVALHEWLKAGKVDGVTMEEFAKYDLDGDQIITADEVLRFNRSYVEAQRIAAIESGTGTGRPSFAGGRGPGSRGPGGPGGPNGSSSGFLLPGASLDPANSSTERMGGKGGERGPGGKGGERGPGGKGGERGAGGKGDRTDRGSDPSADSNTTPAGNNGLWGSGGRKGKN